MKYLLVNIAAILFLTAITVNGQVTGVPNSSPGPCTGGSVSTYTWNETVNTHCLGGIAAGTAGDLSPDACKSSCIANNTCAGVDWDPSNSQKCWWTSSGCTKQPSTGVTHYDLTRTAGSGGNCPATDCSVKWADPIANTNVAGGTPNGAASLDSCKQACEAVSTCRGVDWDSNVGASSKCWLTGDGTLRTGLASGVAHYSILSRPDPSCSAGCIFVSSEGKGVVGIDSDRYLIYSNNIEDGIVLKLSNCLIPPTDSYNGSCVSSMSVAQPGYYVRNYFGKLRLDSASTSADSGISPTRFREDASLVTLMVTEKLGIFWSPFGNDLYVGAVDNYLAYDSVPILFYCIPAQSDAALITGQCPNVWSRVDNARFARSNSNVTSTNCRAAAITSGLANGVSINNCAINDTCVLLNYNTDDTLVPDIAYTHYDLWRQSSGTCNRGCTYTWQWIGSSSSYRQLGSAVSNVVNTYMCQKLCIDLKWICEAVAYNPSTQVCKRLVSDQPWSSQTGVWKLIPKYTGCGPCISSVAYLYDYTDPLAVATAATGSISCFTACINRRGCIGYEIRNGTCYLSTISNSSLVYTPSNGMRITAVYKSPCGNGCVHKWELLPGSYVEAGGTVQNATAVTTETNCRFECINNPTCTGIDWYKDTKKCVLAINYPSVSHRPTPIVNVNHYELDRNDDCDCADGPCEGN